MGRLAAMIRHMPMTDKKTILFYSGHCEIVGGDAKYLFDVVNHLNPNRFDILLSTDRNAVFEERAKDGLKKPISVSYLNTRPQLFRKNIFHRHRYLRALYRVVTFQRLREGWRNFRVFQRLFGEYRNVRPIDIFHFNNGGYPAKEAGLIALVAARRAGVKKTVMSFHNMPVKRRWFRPSDYLYDFFVARNCDKIIAASEALRKSLIESRGFPADKVVTLYCGIEDQRALAPEEIRSYRNQLNIEPEAPVVVICGNLDEDRKGHSPLFHALSKIKPLFPKVMLLVVGEGREDRMAYFNRMVKTLGISENVRFLGYRNDVHELNSVADVVVVPSTGMEATPYTIKEATRAEKPVITTSAGGCAEAVIPDVTGLIVEPNSPEALEKALIRLLKDQELRSRMGKAARQFFLEKFLLQEKIKGHEQVYLYA
jgi:glycosyltransferase involved in cell wall biosynthesis